MTYRDSHGRFRKPTDVELGFPPGFRARIRERFDACLVEHDGQKAIAFRDTEFLIGDQWPRSHRTAAGE